MSATQVKLFEDSNKQALEDTVNKWLSDNQNIEVLSVDFSSSQATYDRSNDSTFIRGVQSSVRVITKYTASVLYKEKGEAVISTGAGEGIKDLL
jgi:hypothetical protein